MDNLNEAAHDPFLVLPYRNECLFCDGLDQNCIGCHDFSPDPNMEAASTVESLQACPFPEFDAESSAFSPAANPSELGKNAPVSQEQHNYIDLFTPWGDWNNRTSLPTSGGNTGINFSLDPLGVNVDNGPIPTFRRRTKSKSQVAALKGWFEENQNPTPAELAEYAQWTGLDKSQVRDWFANQRRPGRRLNASCASQPQTTKAISIPTPPIKISTPSKGEMNSITKQLCEVPNASETMLDRWRSSPPDEEPATFTAIQKALSTSQTSKRVSKLPTNGKSNQSRSVPMEPLEGNKPPTATTIKFDGIPESLYEDFFVEFMHLLEHHNLPQPYNITWRVGESATIRNTNVWYHHRHTAEAVTSVITIENSSKDGIPKKYVAFYHRLELQAAEVDPLDNCDDPSNYVRCPSWHGIPQQDPEHSVSDVRFGLTNNEIELLQQYRQEGAYSAAGSARSSRAPSAASSQSRRRIYKNRYRRSRKKDYQAPDPHVLQEAAGWSFTETLLAFVEEGHKETLEFPSTLTKTDRQNVRKLVRYIGLRSRTYCNGQNRWIVVRNTEITDTCSSGSSASEGARPWKEEPNRIQCTFCNVKLDHSYSWAEHETAWHKPKQEWVCCCARHNGIDYTAPCFFCGKVFPSSSEFFNHACRPYCPELIPVFNFESELVEHLKTVHHFSKRITFEASTWKQPGWCEPPMWNCAEWQCTICKESFRGWDMRVKHISSHHRRDGSRGKKQKGWFGNEQISGLRIGNAAPDSHTTAAVESLRCLLREKGKHKPSPSAAVIGSSSQGPQSWLDRGRAWFSRRK